MSLGGLRRTGGRNDEIKGESRMVTRLNNGTNN